MSPTQGWPHYNGRVCQTWLHLERSQFESCTIDYSRLEWRQCQAKTFWINGSSLQESRNWSESLAHQGNHVHPSTRWSGTNVAGQAFNDLMNLWYSHYLFESKWNSVSAWSHRTGQLGSRLSGRKFDKWESTNSINARAYSKREDVTVSSDFYGTGENRTTRNQDAAFHSSAVSASYAAPVDQDITIKGHIPVNFSASFLKEIRNMPMSARP